MLPSMQEMLPILVILLIIFGARKLPEIGAGLGKGIREFKKSMRDIDEDEDTRERKAIETKGETTAEETKSQHSSEDKKEV